VANATGREDIDAYRGLAWRGGAFPAVTLATFLFSLAGLPPFAGFVGKFYVFAAAMQGKLYWLVVAAVLNSVVSLYYYARVVKMMFLEQPGTDDLRVTFAWSDLGAVGLLSVLTVYLGLRFGWLLERATQAAHLALG
jgi:NADH-quinone oxidoreductase subunit N